MKNIIKKGLSGLKQGSLAPHARRVKTGIFGNPLIFDHPPMTEADFEQLILDYDVSLAGAESRDAAKVVQKNEDRVIVENAVTTFFNFALTKIGNDKVKGAASNFQLVKVPTPVGSLPAPSHLTVKSTATGKARVSFKKVNGSRSYLLQFAPVADENWNSLIITDTRTTLSNLRSLTMYKFQVAAVGAEGQGPFCDVLTSAVI